MATPGPHTEQWSSTVRNYLSLEELVRAVLADQGHDPERWRECSELIRSAFEIWKSLTRQFVPGDELGEHRGTA
jgi:hypothetical protein